MVLVVMLLSTSVFLWTLSQSALYDQAVMEKNQIELDRSSEKVTASNVNYTVAGNIVSVEVILENEGPVSVEIVNLWVIDATINTHNCSGPLYINLKPGNMTYLQGSKAVKVIISGSAPLHQFSSWFVTARGNAVSSTREGGIIVAQVSAGIGSVAMDFASFRYYNVSQVGGSYVLNNYPIGAEGYVVPAKNYIAFEVLLTNYDAMKRGILLFSGSILWTIFPVMGQQPRCAGWYIVNVYGNGTIAQAYTNATLVYGQSAKVIFASINDVNSGGFVPSRASDWYQGNQGSGAVNLMLVGRIGTSTYGQNVPFVSIYFTS